MRSDARLAGSVKRYSTWPVLVQQTNAEHTWQVLRILMTIWPETPAHAAEFALFHDSGELGAGDIPYPYKARHPELREIISELERSSLSDQGVREQLTTDIWRWRIKTTDLIEMLEKGMEETIMGNKYGVPVARAMEAELSSRIDGHEDYLVVSRYLRERWVRFNKTMEMQL